MRGIVELKEAIESGDDRHVEAPFRLVQSSLLLYLRLTFHADEDDAHDAVQQTLIAFTEAVRKGLVRHEDRLGAYARTICKREYQRLHLRTFRVNEPVAAYEPVDTRSSLEDLVDRERLNRVRSCLSALPIDQRRFILRWFEQPDRSRFPSDAAEIRDANRCFARKHRIIKILRTCVGEGDA